MTTFNDVKNEYAKDKGYRYWAHYLEHNDPTDEVYEILAERYNHNSLNEAYILIKTEITERESNKSKDIYSMHECNGLSEALSIIESLKKIKQ